MVSRWESNFPVEDGRGRDSPAMRFHCLDRLFRAGERGVVRIPLLLRKPHVGGPREPASCLVAWESNSPPPGQERPS